MVDWVILQIIFIDEQIIIIGIIDHFYWFMVFDDDLYSLSLFILLNK